MTSLLRVELYDSSNAARIKPLPSRRGLRVLEEFNGVGFGEVSIPTADAGDVALDQVIRVRLDGTTVAAFIIEKRGRSFLDAAGQSWVTLSGRGLLAWLDDAVVYPQIGFSPYSPEERPFNFAGIGGHFEDRVTYTTPENLPWNRVTDGRKGSPKGWPDRTADWIWKTDPRDPVAGGTRNWFKSTLNVDETRKVRFHVTADNYFELYLDGTKILSSSDISSDGNLWRKMATRTLTVTAGAHKLAAKAWNGGNGSSTSRAGFIMSATKVKPNGKPGAVLRHTGAGSWQVTDDEPRWYPSEIMATLIEEAIARDVPRLSNFSIGWTDDEDSTGRDWETALADSIRCGTPYLDVLHWCVDHGVDWWMDPASNELHAYETRGTDRSGGVVLRVAKNLAEYEVQSEATGKTVALTRSADGWTQATNTAGVTARGRRETYLEFGNTRSENTASAAASRILKRTAKNTVTVQRVSAVITPDVRPFLDFNNGDRVSALGTDGAKASARVLSITLLEDDAGRPTYEPELELPAVLEEPS